MAENLQSSAPATQTHSLKPAPGAPGGPWAAPTSPGPLRAKVSLPGSKSQTARHLILSALASSPTVLHGALLARDTQLMAGALRALGVQVELPATPAAPLQIIPPARLRGDLPLNFIDCGLAGTVMRFVPPLAALAEGKFRFSGDAQAAARPLDVLHDALQKLGVPLRLTPGASLPFDLEGQGKINGGQLEIAAGSSSQFVSALLLAAPRFEQGLQLRLRGAVPSLPHLQMTVASLRERGVPVHELTAGGHPVAAGVTPAIWKVEAHPVAGGEYWVEPDLSNAGPFLVAAALCGGSVEVAAWPRHTTQAGDAWRQILTQMGMEITWSPTGLQARAGRQILPLDADLSQVGELVPTIAALAAFASGPSRLRGIGHLRGHETDRLAALAAELEKAGARARATASELYIEPISLPAPSSQTQSIHLCSYADHRMATFAALLGLRLPVILDDVACTSKTLPHFPQLWEGLLAQREA